MNLATTTLPQPWPIIGRADAGLTLISYWSVQSAERQRDAAALAMALWQDVPWPEGMLSHHVFGAEDGKTVMNYSQWRDEASFDAYLASDQPDRARQLESDLIGISRDAIDHFRVYRTMDGTAKGAKPSCLVLVTFDVDSTARQNQLIDTIISVAQPLSVVTGKRASGDIASHFHVNYGGTQVVNVAEFVDAQSHARLVQEALHQDSPVIRAISEMEGVTLQGFSRFELLAGITNRS